MPAKKNKNFKSAGNLPKSAKNGSIHAVAETANVSVATVSRAMNGTGRISEKTREHVISIARRLRYTPSAQAQAMRRGPVDSVGWLMSPSVRETEDEGWIADAAIPLFSAAAAHGFSLIPEQLASDGTDGVKCPNAVLSRRIGSAIVMGEFSKRAMQQLQQWEIPICFWDAAFPITNNRFVNVLNDMNDGTRQAINHLHGLGHQRIGFIHGTLRSNQTLLETYRQMIIDLELDDDQKLIIQVAEDEQNYRGGLHGTRKLLSLKHPPTAICLCTNWYAVGAITAAAEHNIKVPEQLSFVGLTDGFLSRQTDPPLTCVRSDINGRANSAMQLLAQQIRGEIVTQRQVIHPPRLAIRSSTAPCKKSAKNDN